MNLSDKVQWRALPRELARLIAELSGRFKLRDGVLVPQLAENDPRRQFLSAIPRIALSSYFDNDESDHDSDENKILVSVVSTTKPYNDTEDCAGHAIPTFKIYSELLDPSKGRWIHHRMHEDRCTAMYGLYREVVFSFGTKKSGRFEAAETRVIIECNGTAARIEY